MSSFSREIENNKVKGFYHVPNQNYELHTHNNKIGFSDSQALSLPPINQFTGWIRSRARSGFNQATLFSDNGILDYNLTSSGFCEKIFLEFELRVVNAAVSFLPHYAIDRIEYESTEGSPLFTVYGDNVYIGEKLHQSLDAHNRFRAVENLDANYDAVSIPVGTKRIIIPLPSIVDQSPIKLNIINGEFKIKIYFSSRCIVAGVAANLTVSSCDILQKTQRLSQYGETMETNLKMRSNLKFRVLAPIKYTSQSIALAPSGQFDIRLTSGTGLSAYIYFVVRAAPVLGANVNNFVDAVEFFELLDATNEIQGIKTSNELLKWQSEQFTGDILNFKKIYTIPFAIDVDAANSGNQTGFYAMSSNEILRIYTKSTLALGTYEVSVYGLDYQCLEINRGMITIKK